MLYYWIYVFFPVISAFMWFATLWAMLITWLATGRPHYVSMDGSIAYISDIGADILKPLFIVGCSFTALFFFLSLFVERYLRHSGRLVPNMRTRERVCGALAILGSFIGGCGLILLSIFDTKRHPSLHRVFLLVFMIGVALSAIFSIMEFRWLSKDFRGYDVVRRGYFAKAVIASVLILLAIAFGIALFQVADAGAILEWTISFLFTFYVLTFFFDLRSAHGVHKGELSAERFAMERTNDRHVQV